MKDYQMVELWDDRAVQVGKNTGEPVAPVPAPSICPHCGGPVNNGNACNKTECFLKANRKESA